MAKKKRNSESSQPPSPLPPWENDWLYELVFARAREIWLREIRPILRHFGEAEAEKSPFPRYVLLQEYTKSDDSTVAGEAVRAWIYDNDELTAITLEELKQHQAKRKIGRFYPYVWVQFCIYPDRKKVMLGQTYATTAGQGCTYRVITDGENRALEPDPNGGFWIS